MTLRFAYGWSLALAGALLVACQPDPSGPQWKENGLAVGQRTFQKLEPGAVHAVPLQLSGPSFLSAILEPVDSDLELTLRGPQDEELVSRDGSGGSVEFLAAQTERGGAHRLEIKSPSGQGGAYVLALNTLRELRQGDGIRVEGWRELQKAHHAYFGGSKELAREGLPDR